MKVTFPHMGNLYITARTVLEGLGLEVIVPPPCTKKTLTLGTQHSPEFACFPLKVNMGNFLEAREKGAEVIVMAGGVGPCRFGYYAQVQREILRDIGLEMEMVVLEPPDTHFSEVVDKIRYLARSDWKQGVRGVQLAWKKTTAIDAVEQRVEKVRAREVNPGRSDAIYRQAQNAIDRAETREEVKKARKEAEERLSAVPVERDRPVVRIGLVGEIYTMLEPFMNLNIEKHLGTMGAEVVRSLYLSQWVNEHLFGGLLRIQGHRKARRLARPYLGHFVGGHGLESIGCTVEFARRHEADGVIQLAPLTCMPEIVAESILPKVSKLEGIPTMTLFLDEQTGEAGIVTRLEAFVDMIFRQKYSRKGLTG